jgi:hypothetical protein
MALSINGAKLVSDYYMLWPDENYRVFTSWGLDRNGKWYFGVSWIARKRN